ncbi:Gfo/Idh/MocA family oxidoreductase [Bacillus sp. Cs-700]|uniref:Gfo/Idh/MocA family protein n=1 Tax=Bacillus sp. Cs-700 TaxID=2589818 RepID=UPI00140939E2|nr:Gfo/Idh/MocA family oxidoreductase [Bacillus sp. Cs-700]
MNFAIVGCGHIAKKHAEAIMQAEGANLFAVCDTVTEKMEPFIKEYNIEGYHHFEELIANDSVDVINICTPSGFHADLAVKAANAGKHLVVEKPIALTLQDSQKIIDVCKENNVKLSVVHPNRFRPVMIEIKELMNQGKLGKLSHANATVRWNRNQEYYNQAPWRGTKSLDGGVLMNQAIHNLDLILWLMGDVEEVYSMSATRLRDIEAEDVSTGVVRFRNGSLGVIEAATTIYPQNLEETISLFGETGSVKIGGRNATFIEHINIKDLDDQESNTLIEKIKADPFGKPGHQWIIEDMVKAIVEDRSPVVTGEDGKKALSLVLALYESSDQNTPIKVQD